MQEPTRTPAHTSASRRFARQRNSGTKPELAVQTMLAELGVRHRTQVRMHGCVPDIVVDHRATVVAVHGCFWHGHDACACRRPRHRRREPSRWVTDRRARDVRNDAVLRRAGWRVLVIWECDLEHPDDVFARLWDALTPPATA